MWAPIVEGVPFFLWAGAGAFLFSLFLLPYRRPLKSVFRRAEVAQDFGFLFFACVLGSVVGVLTGYSRESAIGAVVPAVLTLLGALVGYVYSGAVTLPPVSRLAILLGALAMTIFFFWGALSGARLREPWERYLRDFEVYKQRLEIQRLQYQAALEKDKLEYQARLDRETLRYKTELEAYRARAGRGQR